MDFLQQIQKLNPTNGYNLLRITAGGFLLPHGLEKFTNWGVNPHAVEFFQIVGVTPPQLWVAIAGLAELIVGISLFLGLFTRAAALGGLAIMILAIYALHTAKGFIWLWNLGGYEYPIFWGIAFITIFMNTRKKQ